MFNDSFANLFDIMQQMSKQKNVQFNCFSPPVMLATMVIEILLAIFAVWRYKMTTLTRLVVLNLVALAVFQLSEYQVCTGFGVKAEDWSRLGYVAISVLPPLGLHILHILAAKPGRRMVIGAYITMIGFVSYFLLYPAAFTGHQCTGNYVIFQIGVRPAIAYGIYYYGWLFTAMCLGIKWANQLLQEGKRGYTRLQTVRALIIGYLVFLVPTALANTISPATKRGIPSIMCGFAVIFALILVLYVLPRVAGIRNHPKT
jgi:hypothetical protein